MKIKSWSVAQLVQALDQDLEAHPRELRNRHLLPFSKGMMSPTPKLA